MSTKPLITVMEPVNDIASYSRDTMGRIRNAEEQRRKLAERAEIAWNVVKELIRELDGRSDCKTAVGILRRHLTTFELETENLGIGLTFDPDRPAPPPPMSEAIWAVCVCVSLVIGFVAGALVMRWMMMGAW